MISIIEKWKNRETKKKLREENKRLKELLSLQCNRFYRVEPAIRVEKVSAIAKIVKYIPDDYVKSELSREIAKEILPYVKTEIIGEEQGYPNMNIWKGTMLIGVLRNESNN